MNNKFKFLTREYNTINAFSSESFSSNMYCINIYSYNIFKNLLIENKAIIHNLSSRIKHIRFIGNWKFECIVNLLSKLEDQFNVCLNGIDICIENNRKLFYEMVDFYRYDIQINIISDNNNNPFSIIHDIFSSPETYGHYGISIDTKSLSNLWKMEPIFNSIRPYIYGLYDKEKSLYLSK